MSRPRLTVFAREYYPWEIELPSKKAAKKVSDRLFRTRTDHFVEDNLLFIRGTKDEMVALMHELGFEVVATTLEEQGQ